MPDKTTSPAQPVEVVNQVEVVMPPDVVKAMVAPVQPSMPPTTTLQEDVTKAGQRRISLLWECTQMILAVSVTGTAIYLAVMGLEAPVLTTAFGFIIGSYFTRTNHTKIGGVGEKPYEGR